MRFQMRAGAYAPAGDQPRAIGELVAGLREGRKSQVLLGVTGSGKTMTVASVIQEMQRPALVLAHNKTLAAQLYQEFKSLFPDNAVEYFVSLYDYYRPEAYISASDTYMAKQASTNDEIDRLRLSATRALFERPDCIVVASVSCIFGLGSPEAYFGQILFLEPGARVTREDIIRRLDELHYERTDGTLERGQFRVRGDRLEVFPAYMEKEAYRVEMFGEEVEALHTVDALTGEIIRRHDSRVPVYARTHHVTSEARVKYAVEAVREEMEDWEARLRRQGRVVEAARLRERTMRDLELLKESGRCPSVEHYSRYLTGRKPGDAPPTLLDYLPQDTIVYVDESHTTLVQFRGMLAGDKARKESLIRHGFRMPSAMDNRPLSFEEFEARTGQTVYVSATPGAYELGRAGGRVVEQVIRPTGLLDPVVDVRPAEGQLDDLLDECRARAGRDERVLVTTLTKQTAEDLTEHFAAEGVRVRYLHSGIETLERIKILRDLRAGEFDVLVGINLLREGLDLPEVSLVAVLDADREGFLRSTPALIQTIGRAARNANGWAILYADRATDAMRRAIEETRRRRQIQMAHNERHGITPRTARAAADSDAERVAGADYLAVPAGDVDFDDYAPERVDRLIERLEAEMRACAKNFQFERAAELRERVRLLRERYVNAGAGLVGVAA